MSPYLHEAQGRGDRLQFAHFSSLFLRDAFEMHRKVLDSGPMVLISIEKTTKHSARGKNGTNSCTVASNHFASIRLTCTKWKLLDAKSSGRFILWIYFFAYAPRQGRGNALFYINEIERKKQKTKYSTVGGYRCGRRFFDGDSTQKRNEGRRRRRRRVNNNRKISQVL